MKHRPSPTSYGYSYHIQWLLQGQGFMSNFAVEKYKHDNFSFTTI